MKQEKELKKWCYTCKNYDAYYTKGHNSFTREKLGYCRPNDKLTESHDTCDKWAHNTIRRKTSKTVIANTLEYLANDISQMRQIMAEEHEENKSNPI